MAATKRKLLGEAVGVTAVKEQLLAPTPVIRKTHNDVYPEEVITQVVEFYACDDQSDESREEGCHQC